MNKHEILAIRDCPVKPLRVEQWGIEIHIKKLNGKERFALKEWQHNLSPEDKKNQLLLVVRFLILTVCDKDGKLLFEDSDFDSLCEKDFDVLCEIFNFAFDLNGFAPDEDLKKN